MGNNTSAASTDTSDPLVAFNKLAISTSQSLSSSSSTTPPPPQPQPPPRTGVDAANAQPGTSLPDTEVTEGGQYFEKRSFPLIGIQLKFLHEFIAASCGGRNNIADKSTHDVCVEFILKYTNKSLTSVANQLYEQGRFEYLGSAKFFISHCWGELFLTTVDTVTSFLKARVGEREYMNTVIWIDLLCISQHIDEIDKPFSWWQGQFARGIRAIGSVIQVVSNMRKPRVLSRAWCVFEIYACKSLGCKFFLAVPEAERWRFFEEFIRDSGPFYSMLGKVITATCEASHEEDLKSIQNAVLKLLPNGFKQLDDVVVNAYEKYVLDTLHALLSTKDDDRVNDRTKLLIIFTLGEIFRKREDYGKAEKFFGEYNSRVLSSFGPDSEASLVAMETLGDLYNKMGQYAKAAETMAYVVQRTQSSSSASISDLLGRRLHLADALQESSQYERAEGEYRDICDVLITSQEQEESIYVFNIMLSAKNSLAFLYLKMNRIVEAEKLFRCCIEDCIKLYSEFHVETINAVLMLASMYTNCNMYNEAEKLYLESLDRLRQLAGPQSPITLQCIADLGSLYCAWSSSLHDGIEQTTLYQKAESLYLEYLNLTRPSSGITDVCTVEYRVLVGNVLTSILYSQGRFEEAKHIRKEYALATTVVPKLIPPGAKMI